jgi:hypothetical protein
MPGVDVPAISSGGVAGSCTPNNDILFLEESERHMTCSRRSLAVLAMTLGHSDGFRVNGVTHRAAQAAAFGKRFVRHFCPPLVPDGAATIRIFMQILSATHTGDFNERVED